ncbi:F-box domain-containing protein [Mycena venus]|uniref:F-box domain-containing protein n=1 Tax=Mycena venus TaxID=2733690 RepID=A0A8H7CP14_9AGAR|nr:F-box domain-containing protein [Mycena venus]
MFSAQESVISTPELLEHTLSLLPLRDLLVTAPLVSRTWRTMALSPTLQRTLFFDPDPSATNPAQNPLLAETFPPFFCPRMRREPVLGHRVLYQEDAMGGRPRCVQEGGRELAAYAGYPAAHSNHGHHTQELRPDGL